MVNIILRLGAGAELLRRRGNRLTAAAVYDRAIDVVVARVRRKIEADSRQPKFIRTERGVGYFFDAPVGVVR